MTTPESQLPTQASPPLVEVHAARLIGRDHELQQMFEAMYAVSEQRTTRIITIVGEPGIGKSRLLRDFRRGVERLPEPIQVLHGRANQELGRLPYGLIRAMFAHYFQIQENDPPAVARARLDDGLRRMLGNDGADAAALIGQMIGLDAGDEPQLRTAGYTRQLYDHGMRAITRFLRAMTQTSPAIIMLEDVHWSDDGALDLVEYLAREGRQIPLLIILLARRQLFDRRPTWGQELPGHLRVDLLPLSEHHSRQLVAEILRKAGRIPPDLRNLIVARSEGNPFYMEELIKMLIEDGIITVGETQWQIHARSLNPARMPATLESLIRSRLEALPANEREVLARAVLVGQLFWASAVAVLLREGALVGMSVGDVLDTLVRREMITERIPSSFAHTREYSFRNTLIFEVAKATLPIQTFRRDHVRIAQWLVEQSGERADSVASMIAEHYEQADEAPQAADWWERAANQARATYALEVAVQCYRKAIALIPKRSAHALRRARMLDGLGDVLRQQARFSEALDVFREAQRIAATTNEPNDEVRIWAHIIEVLNSQERYREALESASQLDELIERCGETLEVSEVLTRKGWALYYLGKPEEARNTGERAMVIATQLNHPQRQALAFSLLGAVYDLMGHYAESQRFEEQALAIYQQFGDRSGETAQLNNLGVSYATVGHWTMAERFFTDSLALAREMGARDSEIVALDNLANAQVRLGRFAEAEANVRASIHLAETLGRTRWAEMYYILAEARQGQGDLDEALTHARQALELSQQAEGRFDLGISWRVLGRLMALLPEHAGARACFQTSATIFEELGNSAERARTLRWWAAYEREKGDADHAQQLLDEARAIFQILGLTLELQQTDASAHL